ncbi:MAG: sigma-54-dependent Fis family transcriptional regulator [Alphaproteobacteria bacterium]|nr:sigma-54-dependent Fis family transcriptional regulator [Alphaproteobacteria bacterium]
MSPKALPPQDGLNVLIVEDDEIMRLSLVDRLKMEGISTASAGSIAEARRFLAQASADLVVTDIRLPDGSGRDFFHEVSAALPGVPVMVMTGYGSVPDAVDLVKAGAIDYLTKPFKLDGFVASVQRVLHSVAEARQYAAMNQNGLENPFRPGMGLLGTSADMRGVERLIARIAPLDSSVLITGESGVGKEVVANMIHHNSRRRNKPFIKVNCAAIPSNLVESELFGHEKGAFTGADKRRTGRFEQAEGGTIFLDEIAEIPPETQVKLLRVLQEREIVRLGGSESISLNVRILAATQVDLQTAITQERFRSDLFWRLNVIRVDIPPLRDRAEDAEYLARRFTRDYAEAMEKRISGLSADASARLQEWPFPGNVRELKNMIERAVALCDGSRLEVHDLFSAVLQREKSTGSESLSLKAAVEEAEREVIRLTLERCNGAVGQAAELLGISRKSLWEKMRRYGIQKEGEAG